MDDAQQDFTDLDYQDVISMMVDPSSWEITLRVGGSFYGFKDIQGLRAMMAHMDECATRIERLSSDLRPVREDDATEAVEWWETAVQETSAWDSIVECVGRFRLENGNKVDGQFLSTVGLALQCSLSTGATTPLVRMESMESELVLLSSAASKRLEQIEARSFLEWMEVDAVGLRRDLVGLLKVHQTGKP
jgi:hypothetical protein